MRLAARHPGGSVKWDLKWVAPEDPFLSTVNSWRFAEHGPGIKKETKGFFFNGSCSQGSYYTATFTFFKPIYLIIYSAHIYWAPSMCHILPQKLRTQLLTKQTKTCSHRIYNQLIIREREQQIRLQCKRLEQREESTKDTENMQPVRQEDNKSLVSWNPIKNKFQQEVKWDVR